MLDKPKVWIAKRTYPSGKLSYTVRWVDPVTGAYGSRAMGRDKKLATNFADKKRIEFRDGIINDVRHVTWTEFADGQVEGLQGIRHRVSVKATLKRFGETCRPKGPHFVTYAMVESYVRKRRTEVKAVTINRELRELRCAFNESVRRGYVRHNPMGTPKDGIRFERYDEPLPEVLTDAEKRNLLDACHTPSWRAFLYLLATTACRRGEILGLTWDRISLDDGYIRLSRTKGKRDRLQPLVGDAVAMLRGLFDDAGKVVDDGQVQPKEAIVFPTLQWNTNRTFNAIRKRAGVPHARMKALRSTACSDAANSGFDVSEAGDFLGHADYGVTRRHYVLRDLEKKRRLAESLAARLRSA